MTYWYPYRLALRFLPTPFLNKFRLFMSKAKQSKIISYLDHWHLVELYQMPMRRDFLLGLLLKSYTSIEIRRTTIIETCNSPILLEFVSAIKVSRTSLWTLLMCLLIDAIFNSLPHCLHTAWSSGCRSIIPSTISSEKIMKKLEKSDPEIFDKFSTHPDCWGFVVMFPYLEDPFPFCLWASPSFFWVTKEFFLYVSDFWFGLISNEILKKSKSESSMLRNWFAETHQLRPVGSCWD